MKKIKNISSYVMPLFALALTVLLFTACKKENPIDYQQPPHANLMAYNLSPEVPAVGFALSGNLLTNTSLGYTSYTGYYLPVYSGNRQIRVIDYYTGTALKTDTASFSDSLYYSTFFMGSFKNLKVVTVRDLLETLTPVAGKAWVRYVNAIPDSSGISVTVGALNENAAYGSVSAFKQIDAGQVNVAISDTANNVNANRTITLEASKIYTILLSGIPNATRTEALPQIKFIANGIATED